MKLLCLVLSVLVLILSARPCCTDQDCERGRMTEYRQAKSQVENNQECLGCSPFFTCGACAMGFVLAMRVTHGEVLVTDLVNASFLPYCQPDLQEVSKDIWQPPRLS